MYDRRARIPDRTFRLYYILVISKYINVSLVAQRRKRRRRRRRKYIFPSSIARIHSFDERSFLFFQILKCKSGDRVCSSNFSARGFQEGWKRECNKGVYPRWNRATCQEIIQPLSRRQSVLVQIRIRHFDALAMAFARNDPVYASAYTPPRGWYTI